LAVLKEKTEIIDVGNTPKETCSIFYMFENFFAKKIHVSLMRKFFMGTHDQYRNVVISKAPFI